MKKAICILFLLLFIPTYEVDAKCMYSDIARLKKIASNVNFSYVYKIKADDAIFNVTLTNLTKDIYFVDMTNEKVYKNKTGEYTLKNYKSGSTVVYNFYSTNVECSDNVLYTIRISLPKYNEYYNNSICNDAREYSLCQKWSSHNLDYSTFLEKVSQYKIEKQKQEELQKQEVDNDSLFHYIIIFLTNYYYIILIVLGGTISIIAYVKNKRNSIYS